MARQGSWDCCGAGKEHLGFCRACSCVPGRAKETVLPAAVGPGGSSGLCQVTLLAAPCTASLTGAALVGHCSLKMDSLPTLSS